MRNLLLLIRNSAFAVAVTGALSFGGAEALSGKPETVVQPEECTLPDYCDDDDDCWDICEKANLPWGGTCNLHWNCCICFE
jgi:hypothetical protein